MLRMLKKLAFLLFFSSIIVIIPSILIDPYNVFHWKKIRDNGVEPNKNFIKMSYILENYDKFDSFLFGSSRVGVIHTDKIKDMHTYNMTYSAGTPAEHLANIKTFLKNGIIPKKILIGVDSLSYTVNPISHNDQLFRSPYEYSQEEPIKFWKKYLNPVVAFQSLSITKNATKNTEFAQTFYQFGYWGDYGIKTNFKMKDAEPFVGDYNNFNETLQDIHEIIDICNSNNIELLIFTNPMCLITYEESVKHHNYISFLQELSKITNFYNFSGVNNITSDEKYYYESSHYLAEVGDLIIDCIFNGIVDEKLYKQGFGWYVTKENFDEFICHLRK